MISLCSYITIIVFYRFKKDQSVAVGKEPFFNLFQRLQDECNVLAIDLEAKILSKNYHYDTNTNTS